MIVLDTNVVSELMRDSPQRQVLSWLDAFFPSTVLPSVYTPQLWLVAALLTSMALLELELHGHSGYSLSGCH